ncbi:unnamed protein product [Medioppia subpectinata]|uniref:Pyrroline-5-carboxylate reductase 3 n=1 Tax=Medioppia subpectinata TaxID=1979941 RepID=A0A7R9L4Q2_9ACAR|nr:unnamed protein product [Medioppia subpectinata]CAG2114321.1 unnamed protein product [Medioppia subpectinata]
MEYPATLAECHVGFIGAGNMAHAMATGFVKSGAIRADRLTASAPSNRNLHKFTDLGCHVTNNSNALFAHLTPDARHRTLKVIFICVKPGVFTGAADDHPVIDLDQYEDERRLVVVSVMAGVKLATIRARLVDRLSFLPSGAVDLIRVMPNTACALNAGCCGVCTAPADAVSGRQRLDEFAGRLLAPLGTTEFVDERLLDAVCGLGGSGIAFVYTMIHAMADGGLKMGLPRTVATNIATQTLLGAALMVQQTGRNPIALRDEVTSPGGTTIHGLHALTAGGFDSAVMAAVEAATKRSQELSGP